MKDRFKILRGIRDGHDWIGSVDSHFKDNNFEKKDNLFACEIWIELNKKTHNGLPDHKEFSSLENFEVSIKDILFQKSSSIEIGKISWNNKRYLLYYISDPENAAELLDTFFKKSDWVVEYSIFNDPELNTAHNNFRW